MVPVMFWALLPTASLNGGDPIPFPSHPNLLNPVVPKLPSPGREEAISGVREGFGSGCLSELCGWEGGHGTEITKHCKRQKDPNSGESSWARLCPSISCKDVLDQAGLGGLVC